VKVFEFAGAAHTRPHCFSLREKLPTATDIFRQLHFEKSGAKTSVRKTLLFGF